MNAESGSCAHRNAKPGGNTVKRLFAVAVLTFCGMGFVAAAEPGDDDTTKAAATRKKLQTKITVKFKETRLEDAVDEIKDMVPGVSILLDAKGGVSRNQAINYEGKDVTLADALDGMFKKNGLGYYIRSGKNDAYDGAIWVKQGKERGFPIKEEEKDKPKDKDKPADKDKKDK
jgi:hypothetical protein